MSALLSEVIGNSIDPGSLMGQVLRETARQEADRERRRRAPNRSPWGQESRRPLGPALPPALRGPAAAFARARMLRDFLEGLGLLDGEQAEETWAPLGLFQGGPGWTDITGNCAPFYPQGLGQPLETGWYKNAVCNPAFLSSLPGTIDPASEALIDGAFGMRAYSNVESIGPDGRYVGQVWQWNAGDPGADPQAYPRPGMLPLQAQPTPRVRSWAEAARRASDGLPQGYEGGYAAPGEAPAPEPVRDPLARNHVWLDLRMDPKTGLAVVTRPKLLAPLTRPVLEDLINPRPVTVTRPLPRVEPVTRTKPLPREPDSVMRVPRGRGEQKLTMPRYRRWLFVRALEGLLEACDIVDALWKALPAPIRKIERQRWVEGEFERGEERPAKSIPCNEKIPILARNTRFLEAEPVMRELLWQEIEDWLYGKSGQYSADALGRVQKRSGGTVSPGYDHWAAPPLPTEQVEQFVTGRAERDARPSSWAVRQAVVDEMRRRTRNRSAEKARRAAYRRQFGDR